MTGNIPIKRIVKLLFENGYSGYFSLEWEIKWRKKSKVMGSEAEAEAVSPDFAE